MLDDGRRLHYRGRVYPYHSLDEREIQKRLALAGCPPARLRCEIIGDDIVAQGYYVGSLRDDPKLWSIYLDIASHAVWLAHLE